MSPIRSDPTLSRANRASHALIWMPRPLLPSLGQRVAIYFGSGAALVVIILETLLK